MAQSMDDGEFWLPPQFLTDDDVLVDVNNSKSVQGRKDLFSFEVPFGFESSFGGSSDLSSPVESVLGSPETESDEEDFLAGLTRQMAQSTLDDDLWRNDFSLGSENKKCWVFSGSPQSTLCTVGSGCGCMQGSSCGSPNRTGRVTSPPTTWDLLHAAAGEVASVNARMRMIEERLGLYSHGRGFQPPPRKPSPVSVPVKSSNHDLALYMQQPLSNYQKLQASQFQQLRQQQMMKQQQNCGVWGGQHLKGTGLYQLQQPHQVIHRGRNAGSRPLGLSASAWPPLQLAQQQPQSGLRGGFLGNPVAKKECAGTGVFLPRPVRAPTESRKKSACPRVFLPARVVQALNLNLEEMGAQPQFQPRFNGNYVPESDIASRHVGGNILSNPKRNLRPQPGMSNEARLPQEWTY